MARVLEASEWIFPLPPRCNHDLDQCGPIRPRRGPSVREQYRNRERFEQLARGAAQGPLLEPRVTVAAGDQQRSEEHTSELQSLMRISYAVFCLKKKKRTIQSNEE